MQDGSLDPAAGPGIAKTLPAVVLTNDIVNQRRRKVVVVPLSGAPSASPPILVPIRCAGRDAVAVIDQIRAVSKQRLKDRVGEVSTPEPTALEEAELYPLQTHAKMR